MEAPEEGWGEAGGEAAECAADGDSRPALGILWRRNYEGEAYGRGVPTPRLGVLQARSLHQLSRPGLLAC